MSGRSGDTRQLRAARGLFEAAATVVDVPLAVRLWDGTRVSLAAPGSARGPAKLEIGVASPGVLGSLLRRPRLETLALHYAEGRIDLIGGDLLELVAVLRTRPDRGRDSDRGHATKRGLREVSKLALMRHALPLLFARDGVANDVGTKRGAAPVGAPVAVGQVSARDRSREDVQFHYDLGDLGNDFYALFLDAEMQYSCGYFRDARAFFEAQGPSEAQEPSEAPGARDASERQRMIDAAQRDKLEITCRKLRLRPGERLLDIGCGWGGLVCHAAREHGVEALGITLSRQQHDYTQRKIAALGLEKQVEVRLADYRELSAPGDGTFDKIASVGMVEHVGIASYPEYFSRLGSLLRDRGLLLNHGITRGAKKTERAFRRRRPEKRLMLRYVFPGHELDHIGHTLSSMEAHGFEVRDVEDWREHYALTTRLWFERLSARESEAEALVGRGRYRIWLAYLAGVSTAFSDGSLRIYQVLASRHRAKGPSELPPTRADLYT